MGRDYRPMDVFYEMKKDAKLRPLAMCCALFGEPHYNLYLKIEDDDGERVLAIPVKDKTAAERAMEELEKLATEEGAKITRIAEPADAAELLKEAAEAQVRMLGQLREKVSYIDEEVELSDHHRKQKEQTRSGWQRPGRKNRNRFNS